MEFLGIHQANYLEAVKGLSDPCPVVIENVVNIIFSLMNNLVFGGIVFNGWKGIGKVRILKYVAKRAMEAKSYDIVIWMIEKRNVSSIVKFQMQVAEQLGITSSKDNDSDDDEEDEGTVDEVVSRKIAAYLEHNKFVLVHNGNWEFSDLMRIGIPVGRGANYAMVLVASSDAREYHRFVPMENLSSQEVLDLVYEECIDIAHCPSFIIGGITPDDVMGCIMWAFIPSILLPSLLMRTWFIEGFIRVPSLDLKTIFGLGQIMWEELCDRFSGAEIKDILLKSNEHILKLLLIYCNDNGIISMRSLRDENHSPQVVSTILTIGFKRGKELPDDIFERVKELPNVRTIYLSFPSKSFPSSIFCLTNLRFLILHSCDDLEPSQLYSISNFKKLEMLFFTELLFKEFPDNMFEGLESLRHLDLSECSELSSLPSSIFCLVNLEYLCLCSCQNLSVLPSSIKGFEKLQVLEMTKTKLREIPDQFFQSMCSLKELDLSLNLHLTSIHTSLHNVDHVTSSSSNIFPDLQILNLSSVPVSQLSLKNRSSLEIVTLSNNNLEKLDVSNTKLKKFPIQGDENLIPLKQLDLLNTKHLMAVDWKDIKWLPQEVNWAQYGDGITSHMYIQPSQRSNDGNGNGVFISVGKANFFRTLTPSSTLWAKSMSRFVVYVCPWEERGKGKTPWKAPLRYDDFFSKFKRSIPSYERCLEMERVNKPPKGISGILSHAQFLSCTMKKSL